MCALLMIEIKIINETKKRKKRCNRDAIEIKDCKKQEQNSIQIIIKEFKICKMRYNKID